MAKTALQKPGLHKVCKNCGGMDPKLVGSQMVCTVCGKSEFVEMDFVARKQFLREMEERAKMKKFSFYLVMNCTLHYFYL